MTTIRTITVDCTDAEAVGRFWELLLGWPLERLLEAGGSIVGDHRKPDGTGWVVMADPEGNEFCVERSDAERNMDS